MRLAEGRILPSISTGEPHRALGEVGMRFPGREILPDGGMVRSGRKRTFRTHLRPAPKSVDLCR